MQHSTVPKNLLRDWANATFASATDYWTFRKVFTLQLSLAGFAEYVLHLSRLNPDMMYVHQDCGLINISYFKFDVDDVSGELDSNRPVPFRLTPNVYEFVTETGVRGPLTASMIAAARCFVHPSFKIQAILRAVLRDEMITWNNKANRGRSATAPGGVADAPAPEQQPQQQQQQQKQQQQQQPGAQPENTDREVIISMVNKAVTTITQRLTSLSSFDGTESKVSTLVAAANSPDNLCRMDPAWHPWL